MRRSRQDLGPCSLGSFLTLSEEAVRQHRGSLLWTGRPGFASKSILFARPRDAALCLTGVVEAPWKCLQEACLADPSDRDPRWLFALTYEFGRPQMCPQPNAEQPLAVLQEYEEVWVYEHGPRRLLRIAECPLQRWRAPAPIQVRRRPQSASTDVEVRSNISASLYQQRVEEVLEEILDGEFYQLNLTHEFTMGPLMDPWACFLDLQLSQRASMAGFLQLPYATLLSVSPERLLRKQGAQLLTSPIKGTMKRGGEDHQDHGRALRLDPKELSELRMITDLLRNDLGRVSLPGSVQVSRLFATMPLRHLYHLYSIVKGRVPEDLHPFQALASLFPGGSISGCPKRSALDGIARYEQRPRGWYTGSIGYCTPSGDLDSNLLIRTVVAEPAQTSLGVGAGLVLGSRPVKEWEETLHKASPILDVLKAHLAYDELVVPT